MGDTQFLTILIGLLSAVLLLGAASVIGWVTIDRLKEGQRQSRKDRSTTVPSP
jgi:Co/Zn/Cd efflux system component